MTVRRILTFGVLGLAGLALVFGVSYQFFGVRVVLTGGGMPTLQFVMDAEERARIVARHRAEQREQHSGAGAAEPPSTAANNGVSDSQHMRGTAADLDNEGVDDEQEWDDMKLAGENADPDFMTEKTDNSACGNQLKCVHADWRNKSGDYN